MPPGFETTELALPWGPTVELVGPADDQGITSHIARHGHYQPETMLLLASVVPRDGWVLDVGANIGALTVAMAECVPAGGVVACEPIGPLFEALEANTARYEHVSAHRLALGATDGTLRLRYSTAFPAGATAGAVDGLDAVEDCVQRTIDSWYARERLDLVKIDVEGGETDVLRGARATIAELGPDLVLECHPVMLRRCGSSVDELWRELRRSYPRVFSIEAFGRLQRILGEGHLKAALGRRGSLDLYCTRRRRGRRLGVPSAARPLLRRIRLGADRWHMPRQQFLIDPRHRVRVQSATDTVPAGGELEVTVEVDNHNTEWMSGEFTPSPVVVVARWAADAGPEDRRVLDRSIRPGRRGTMPMTLAAPTEPGVHELTVTTLQDHYTWHDSLAPDAVAARRITVV